MGVGVLVDAGVEVRVLVAVRVGGSGVGVFDAVGETVGVSVLVGVGVLDGVAVAVTMRAATRVWLGWTVGTGVGAAPGPQAATETRTKRAVANRKIGFIEFGVLSER